MGSAAAYSINGATGFDRRVTHQGPDDGNHALQPLRQGHPNKWVQCKKRALCMYVYVCAFEDDDSTFAFPFTTVVESQWMAERPPRTTSCRPGDRATHCYIKRYIVVVL